MSEKFTLIDPPVTPYSTKGEIDAWIKQLNEMPASAERDLCIKQAKAWLEDHADE